MTTKIATSVRCFKRYRSDDKRCGVWLMTGLHRGAFFHGDRDTIDTPHYTLDELDSWARGIEPFMSVEEISPEEAIEEFRSWSKGQSAMIDIFERHPG